MCDSGRTVVVLALPNFDLLPKMVITVAGRVSSRSRSRMVTFPRV